MLRLLIADDHPVFRRGLKQIIAETADMVVSGEAADGQEALSLARTDEFDVVLLDITMPTKNGLDALTALKKERPGVPVLVLSMHPEEQFAIRALRSGASGYLTKESAPDELLAAIRKVSSGGKYVTASLAEQLASIVGTAAETSAHDALTAREYQVMCLIASGRTVSETARELSLSVKTVSTYRARILEKLHVENNAQLIRYAIECQLVE